MTDRLREALNQINEGKPNWHDGVGSYSGGETYEGFARRLQQIARAALAEPDVCEWIDVKERLPDLGEVVWLAGPRGVWIGSRVTAKDGWGWGSSSEATWFDGERWQIDPYVYDDLVTHWMALPEPPSYGGDVEVRE